MPSHERRQLLKASAAGVLFAGFDLLLPVSQAAALDIGLEPDLVKFGPEMDPLVRLIQITPREQCVPVFMGQLKAGLSYQRFLGAIFLAATQTGDMHQLAQVYAAHRTSREARIEERLLPLFWALDRIKRGHESSEGTRFFLRTLKGPLPAPSDAALVFQAGMSQQDPDQAERAVVVLARSEGARQAMYRLWEFSVRDLAGSLGHMPIGLANAWRTLDAIGWQHAEPALRYMTRQLSQKGGDRTYAPNVVRAGKTLANLPADWAANDHIRSATLGLYGLLREGDTAAACDLICSVLSSGQAKAGSLWDAVSLAAADAIFRYRTGGSAIGGSLVHVVTSTNALRFGFNLVQEPRTRLLALLQAAGVTADFFVRRAGENGQLRSINMIEDLQEVEAQAGGTYREVFEMLPRKSDTYIQKSSDERAASDQACRMAFSLLREPTSHRVFRQAARSLLCMKASEDPHDIKYPAACFEDADWVNPGWRPFILASSVHALHGTQSDDSDVLVQAQNALG